MTTPITSSKQLGKPDPAEACSTSVPCVHCGLPSPAPTEKDALPFCCNGCRGAYALIQQWGLEDYYALRDQLVGTGEQVGTGSGSQLSDALDTEGWLSLDDPEAFGDHAPEACGEGWVRVRLAVAGLHCGACAWLIERAARQHAGWQSARVRLSDHTAELIYDPEVIPLSQIAAQMSRLGYRVSPLVSGDAEQRRASENRALLIAIATAGFCAANAMWIAVALYAGEHSGIDANHGSVLRWSGVILACISVGIPGNTFLRGALASLRTRTPHMDLPVALGITTGCLAGVVSVVRGGEDNYFDSVTMLVFLLLVGRWVQFRQQHRAAEAVSLLMRLTPRQATRVNANGTTSTVWADRLDVGEIVRVGPRQAIPADGRVVVGESRIDRSLVTGESLPIAITVGDAVLAGCHNVTSSLDVEVTAVGTESRVGRLTQLIEDAAGEKAPLVQRADRIGGVFVFTVVGLAVLTAYAWWPHSPGEAINHSVALLIVACPCALALATPLALAVAVGRAASRGILIRGADVMERLAKPGVIWFDKTGTLTLGRLDLVRLHGCSTVPEATILAEAVALESGVNHPVASAIQRKCGGQQRIELVVVERQIFPGMGVTGMVSGHALGVGNSKLLAELGATPADREMAIADQIISHGLSPLWIVRDGQVVAVGGVGDELRSGALETVQRLSDRGWEVGMLSGDHPETALRIGKALGLEPDRVLGGVSPEEKLEVIRQSSTGQRGSRPVVMVGDGVNDAAALAAADVGIAIRGGASASLQAAPVYLPGDRLLKLDELMAASARTVRTVGLNFGLSVGYNAFAAGLAMLGWISPLIAAVLMPISSLTVLSVVLTRRTFRDSKPDGSREIQMKTPKLSQVAA
ncbi:MAG: heavy metal translocating P-type ATPase [Planctomycetota bacterium]